jgi:hypothetical protein
MTKQEDNQELQQAYNLAWMMELNSDPKSAELLIKGKLPLSWWEGKLENVAQRANELCKVKERSNLEIRRT